MKKFNILIVAALAVAGWSCQDEKNDTPLPSNPQQPVMTAEDFAVAANVPGSINLTNYNEDTTPVTLGKVTKLTNLPEGYTLKFVGTMGREAEYVHAADFAVNYNPEDSILSVAPDALEGAYVAAIGKSAKPKQVNIRVAAYAVNGDAQVRLGGADTYYLTATPTVTPFDLKLVIEDAYGLLGTINGWSVANAVLFNHDGNDPYDNPVFTLTVNISDAEAEGGWWWKIVPASTIATGNWVDAANASFGCAENGSHDLEGALVPRTDTEDCGAGCVNEAGVYTLTIDMENQTYEFVRMYDFLYTPGDANGWSHASAQKIPGAVGGTEFKGFAKLQGSFKFTDAGNWNGTNYGAGTAAGTLSTDGSAGNLSVAEAGLYFCNVNTETLKYSVAKINSLGMIGGFNGWGSQTVMTSTDGLVYTGTVALSAGDEFKFRMNDNWDINLGGDTDNLTVGGANIVVKEAGNYTVTLDLSKVPYSCTISK